MIVTYIQVTSNGQIKGSGVIQEEAKDFIQPLADCSVVFGVHADPSSNVYYDGTNVVSMPNKPSDNHIFDYAAKKWVFDLKKAEDKALKQRDKLLAEGPDRISPMWWSAMTNKEQMAWAQYRQDLLDITGQADYPEFIVWPIKP